MKNENIMCIKYLILELKQNKSSAKPINDNKLQIKIIWDISLLPLKVTNIIFSELKKALKREERVEIRGWGSLSIRNQKSSIRRNPKTGEKIAVPAKKVIHWKMSKEMFKKINNEKE